MKKTKRKSKKIFGFQSRQKGSLERWKRTICFSCQTRSQKLGLEEREDL